MRTPQVLGPALGNRGGNQEIAEQKMSSQKIVQWHCSPVSAIGHLNGENNT